MGDEDPGAQRGQRLRAGGRRRRHRPLRLAQEALLLPRRGRAPRAELHIGRQEERLPVRRAARRPRAVRALLVQAAKAVLNSRRGGALREWGPKVFARRGSRNIAVVAVVAVARKLVVQVWYELKGSVPEHLDAGGRRAQEDRRPVCRARQRRGHE